MSKRTKFLLGIGVIAALVMGWQIAAFAGPVGLASGFQDDDGNLIFTDGTAQQPLDWNSFDPTDWTGTAPYQRTDATDTGGWDFTGIQDAANLGTDTAFAGGVKQNDDCAALIGQKANNKDDLKRIYLSSKTLANGHVVLNLAWVRIPQNTTSPSAHVAFEFNQNDPDANPCTPARDTPTGSLVPRSTANGGDMLVLYDFEGGTDTPTIRISRWTASGWSAPVTLTSGQAEAKVNTTTSVVDALSPPDGSSETLGIKEFGEAGLDLTSAGVFPATPTSCLSFGNAFGVTRTSGNSNTAQMKDIAGPGEINLSNCGTVIIRKVTDPAGDTTTDFGYTTNVTTLPATTTSPFSLKDGEHNTISNAVAGSNLNVAEDDPSPGYALTDIDCTASIGIPASDITTSLTTRDVNFALGAGDTLDCTFTNTEQAGALAILKNSTKGGAVSTAGAVFSYDGSSVTDNGTGDEDPAIGSVCVSGLDTGDYTVNETSAPDGYGGAPATEADQSVTVVSGTNCTDSLPAAGATATFTNPPLSDIQVNFRDGGSGETSAVISCDNTTGTGDNTPATDWDTSETVTGVDAPTTVNCAIVIDP